MVICCKKRLNELGLSSVAKKKEKESVWVYILKFILEGEFQKEEKLFNFKNNRDRGVK